MTKRTLDSFFKAPPAKKSRLYENALGGTDLPKESTATTHPSYPWPIPSFPPSIAAALTSLEDKPGKAINNQPDLDLLYFQPFIPYRIEHELFHFLREELFFYRVKYKIKRGPIETEINTPRYTTVFGVDETSRFHPATLSLLEANNPGDKSIPPKDRYRCTPRPIPACLNALRLVTEAATGSTYNFCLVNYYASGADSISYHSDDERFLGANPSIASFSLGAKRDFLMKHKPVPPKQGNVQQPAAAALKLPLASGDMVLTRGTTQANWLHSIPKRKAGESEKGRINITFRKAMVPAGTENYYRYNVGDGEVYRWDRGKKEMASWKPPVA